MPKIKSTPVIQSRAALESHLHAVVAAQIEREAIVAERDDKIEQIRAKYIGRIDGLAQTIETGTAIIEQWADAHRDEFGRARSIDVDGHRIGWRTGTPAARLASKKWTWAKVVAAVSNLPAEIRDRWLRTKVEPNKDAMIDDRESQAQLLEIVGVEITQAESFYIDPARDGQADTRIFSKD